MSEYIETMVIPNGYNGGRATAHIVKDALNQLIAVWQVDGMTGWFRTDDSQIKSWKSCGYTSL